MDFDFYTVSSSKPKQTVVEPELSQDELFVRSTLEYLKTAPKLNTLLERSASEAHTSIAESLQQLSISYDVDSLLNSDFKGSLSRTNLKNQLNSDVLTSYVEYLTEFSPIIDQLAVMEDKVNRIEATRKKLIVSAQHEDLTELHQVTLSKQLLVNFKNMFTLDQYEDHVINMGEIDEEFFKVLDKIEEVNTTVSVLLNLEDASMAHVILRQMNQAKTTALRRLKNFVLDGGNDDRAIKWLQGQEEYNELSREMCDRRSQALNREIHNFQSNIADPIRYVGDLLALVHSLIVNESTMWSLDSIIGSLAPAVKSRIDTIVKFETHPRTCFDMIQFFKLYQMIYGKVLSEKNPLLKMLAETEKYTTEKIVTYFKSLLGTEDTDDFIPEWVVVYFNECMQLMDRDSWILPDSILYDGLDSVSSINSLDFICGKVLVDSFQADVEKKLHDTIEKRIQEELKFMYESSGLKIYTQLVNLVFPIDQIQDDDDYMIYSSLIENNLFSLERLGDMIKKVDVFLPIAMQTEDTRLLKITSPKIVEAITSKVFNDFIAFYKVMFMILNELYPEEKLLTFTVEQARTLLI